MPPMTPPNPRERQRPQALPNFHEVGPFRWLEGLRSSASESLFVISRRPAAKNTIGARAIARNDLRPACAGRLSPSSRNFNCPPDIRFLPDVSCSVCGSHSLEGGPSPFKLLVAIDCQTVQ